MVLPEYKTRLKVRYGETDQMGYVYYGNYASFLEVARLEWLKNIGLSYKELEASGLMLPVYNYNIKYISPAFYDEELTIVTKLKAIPSIRIEFSYEIYNQHQLKISIAETTLVFIDANTRKPMRCPDYIIERVKQFSK